MLPEKREKIITNARLAMEFADKMQELKEKREQSLYVQVKEPVRILINDCFENEERKLKKQYGVMQYESVENQGYGRLYQEPKNYPTQERNVVREAP